MIISIEKVLHDNERDKNEIELDRFITNSECNYLLTIIQQLLWMQIEGNRNVVFSKSTTIDIYCSNKDEI